MNETDEYGYTGLHMAAENGHMEIVNILLVIESRERKKGRGERKGGERERGERERGERKGGERKKGGRERGREKEGREKGGREKERGGRERWGGDWNSEVKEAKKA